MKITRIFSKIRRKCYEEIQKDYGGFGGGFDDRRDNGAGVGGDNWTYAG
jgi:hypothetical protein